MPRLVQALRPWQRGEAAAVSDRAPPSSYEELAAGRRDSDEYLEGYAEARRAFLIGQAVRERRLAAGLSQVELPAPLQGPPL